MANNEQDERKAVRFPGWHDVLEQMKLGEAAKMGIRQGIFAVSAVV